MKFALERLEALYEAPGTAPVDLDLAQMDVVAVLDLRATHA